MDVLRQLVIDGDLAELSRRYVKGMNLNCGDDANPPLICLAAKHGHLDIVKWLHSKGVSLRTRTEWKTESIHYAAEYNRVDIFDYLYYMDVPLDARSEAGSHWTPGFYAVLGKATDIISWHIDNDLVNVLYRRSINGRTLMHLAANCGHVDIMKILYQHWFTYDVKDNNGCTPLHHAACKYHSAAVDLITSHCSYDQFRHVSRSGETPIHFAAMGGHNNIISQLRRAGINLQKRNDRGQTCMAEAVCNDNVKTIKFLRDQGLSFLETSIYGESLIHLAAFREAIKSIDYLWKVGLSLDNQTNNGLTPLHLSVLEGKLQSVKRLYQLGANHILPDTDIEPKDYLDYSKIVMYLSSKPRITPLRLLCLRIIYIHDIDVSYIPKMLLYWDI